MSWIFDILLFPWRFATAPLLPRWMRDAEDREFELRRR